jgi:serine/threonine protein phosphatase PrpC
VEWQFGTASDIGGRNEQQDRVEVIASREESGYLVVVADGMGGYNGGARAAQAVVDTARRSFEAVHVSDPLAFLEALCAQTHQAVVGIGEREGEAPGSTCVFLYVSEDEACWAHIGDSRLYHFRNGGLLTRTLDHSVVQLLVARGEMAEAEMAASPLQNQLYMRLGAKQQPSPALGAAEAQDGDFFVLCSDGFWESIDPQEVEEVMSRTGLPAAADRLVRLARERGGDDGDNIAVAMAQLGRIQKKRFWLFP